MIQYNIYDPFNMIIIAIMSAEHCDINYYDSDRNIVTIAVVIFVIISRYESNNRNMIRV